MGPAFITELSGTYFSDQKASEVTRCCGLSPASSQAPTHTPVGQGENRKSKCKKTHESRKTQLSR